MSYLDHKLSALTALLGPSQVISDASQLAWYRLDGLRPSRGYRDRSGSASPPAVWYAHALRQMSKPWCGGPMPPMWGSSPMAAAPA